MLNLEATSKHQAERKQAYDDVRNFFLLPWTQHGNYTGDVLCL